MRAQRSARLAALDASNLSKKPIKWDELTPTNRITPVGCTAPHWTVAVRCGETDSIIAKTDSYRLVKITSP